MTTNTDAFSVNGIATGRFTDATNVQQQPCKVEAKIDDSQTQYIFDMWYNSQNEDRNSIEETSLGGWMVNYYAYKRGFIRARDLAKSERQELIDLCDEMRLLLNHSDHRPYVISSIDPRLEKLRGSA